MRPYMCVPHSLQAWRWIVALESTTFSLFSFFVTLTLSRGATATTANSAPAGFQHLVQPQAWLCAVWEEIFTSTGLVLHLQVSVPPAKSFLPGFTPPSTEGWIETFAISGSFPLSVRRRHLFLLASGHRQVWSHVVAGEVPTFGFLT